MKKASAKDKVRIMLQALALARLKGSYSDINKVINSMKKYKFSEEDKNFISTEILSEFLINDNMKFLINILPVLKFPKKFDKMNDWLFLRLLVRLKQRVEKDKISNVIKLFKHLLLCLPVEINQQVSAKDNVIIFRFRSNHVLKNIAFNEIHMFFYVRQKLLTGTC